MNEVEKLLVNEEQISATDFTIREFEIFVACIMSGNISDKYIYKALMAMGMTMRLSFEEPEVYVEDNDEDDGFDEPTFNAEIFVFANTCADILFDDKNKNARKDFCTYLRDFLLEREAYKALHILDLERLYSI